MNGQSHLQADAVGRVITEKIWSRTPPSPPVKPGRGVQRMDLQVRRFLRRWDRCRSSRTERQGGILDEPPHVHVDRDDQSARFWLKPWRWRGTWDSAR
jgi:hypothetical protein